MVDVLRGLVSLFVALATQGNFSRRRCRLRGARTHDFTLYVSASDCHIGFPCGVLLGLASPIRLGVLFNGGAHGGTGV